MSSDVVVQVQGGQEVLQVLEALRGRMDNQTTAWQEAGDDLVDRAEKRFDTKTDPAGHPWAPWRRRTAKLRAKEGRGTLLEHTGLLRASLNAEARPDGLTLGAGRSYAVFHETGTKWMARRGFFLGQVDPEAGLGEGDERLVIDILTRHLSGESRG